MVSGQETHVRVVNVVKPGISPVSERLRSGDLDDEEEKEEEERVHDDRPAMDTAEGKEA